MEPGWFPPQHFGLTCLPSSKQGKCKEALRAGTVPFLQPPALVAFLVWIARVVSACVAQVRKSPFVVFCFPLPEGDFVAGTAGLLIFDLGKTAPSGHQNKTVGSCQRQGRPLRDDAILGVRGEAEQLGHFVKSTWEGRN